MRGLNSCFLSSGISNVLIALLAPIFSSHYAQGCAYVQRLHHSVISLVNHYVNKVQLNNPTTLK